MLWKTLYRSIVYNMKTWKGLYPVKSVWFSHKHTHIHIASGIPDLRVLNEKGVPQALNQLDDMEKYTIRESLNQKIFL